MKNAGFEIASMEYAPYGEGVEGVALGVKEGSFGLEYVTWQFARHPSEDYSFFWGHYFTDERAARIDYHKRAIRLYGEEA